MKYCGIDLADKASAVCVIDEQGKEVRRTVVKTDAMGLSNAVAKLGRVKVIVEACPLAEWACQVLEKAGCEAQIIDARAAKHLVSSKKKTDARDAKTLAHLARSGWFTPVHRKSDWARTERTRLQGRVAIQKTRQAMVSTIRGLLKAHGVKLGQVSEGRFVEKVQDVVSKQLPQLVETFEHLLKVWQQAHEGREPLEKSIKRDSRRCPIRRQLQTVHSVGPLISTAFVATIDDPNRFERGEQVADYVGLTPRVYQSGEVEYRGRITKEGDNLVRWLSVEGSHHLLTQGKDCALKRWGLKLAQRKGGAKARVAVARKLVILLWKLWRDGETFTPWPQGHPAPTELAG